MSKEVVKSKAKKHRGGVAWFLGISALAIALLVFCQFFFSNGLNETDTFLQNTKINGVDVSGLTQKQAENIVAYNLLNTRDEVELTLRYENQEWVFNGSDFEIANDISERVKEIMTYGHDGNFIQRRKVAKQAKKEGLDMTISYKNVLAGVDDKVNQVADEIDRDSTPAKVVFNPNDAQMFQVDGGQSDLKVDREKLHAEIDKTLAKSKKAYIEIPVVEIANEQDTQSLLDKIGMRSKFSTSYASSGDNRKNNVKRALEAFNGRIVEQGERVSFNETTGPRSEENGYKKANIIVNGAYVEGSGGGVCQASTTLYNALVLSGVDILEANHHTLPASYVPLSFDAMVSEGTSDLIFENNTGGCLYIKTYATDTDVYVEIYGDRFPEGEGIKTRAELIKTLPHNGDKIVSDTTGEYSNFVVYKGEYYRVKYPREGFESKGYVQYLKDGEIIGEKEIRHDYYWPQEGIIVEGTEEVTEGIALPPNTVKVISPQKSVSTQTKKIVEDKYGA